MREQTKCTVHTDGKHKIDKELKPEITDIEIAPGELIVDVYCKCGRSGSTILDLTDFMIQW